MKAVTLTLIAAAALMARGDLSFDAGADLRIRQEFIMNCTGLPEGGLATPACGAYRHQMRFRPRVWGEVKGDAGEYGKWRLFARLCDEFRWNTRPYSTSTSWPGEVIFDNLFIEGKDLFDGFIDVQIGRRDLYGYCNLDHIFVDGTPGDGSRTQYTDMANVRFKFENDATLDVFGLYNFDNAKDFRWGDDDHRFSSLAARYPNGQGNQDDWGIGVVWGQTLDKSLKYQIFAVQKQMLHQEKAHTELIGARVMPRWTEEWQSEFEAMSELNGQWSGFASLAWKSSREGIKPLAKLSYHYLSEEWDPMWARDAIESELFLYGTHDGVAWWTNQHYLKLQAGLEFSPRHSLIASTGPMFAARPDGRSGRDGSFKGLYSRIKYSFPIVTADRTKGERFEIFAHLTADLLNPGDYYASEKPAWYARWQVEFKF